MFRKKKAKYHPLTSSAPSALAHKTGNSAPEIYSVSLIYGSTALVPLPTELSKECHFVSFPGAEKSHIHAGTSPNCTWSVALKQLVLEEMFSTVVLKSEIFIWKSMCLQCKSNIAFLWKTYTVFANIWNVPLLKEWQYHCGVVKETSCSFLWLWCSLLQSLHVYDFLLLEMK